MGKCPFIYGALLRFNVASSSVTIRVELRWIYVSLAGALLFLAWMYGELTNGVKKELYLKRIWPGACSLDPMCFSCSLWSFFTEAAIQSFISGQISCAIILWQKKLMKNMGMRFSEKPSISWKTPMR